MSDKSINEEAVFAAQPPRHTAFKISLIYASISVIWILFSDQLLPNVAKDIETITWIQMGKGWLFVLSPTAEEQKAKPDPEIERQREAF